MLKVTVLPSVSAASTCGCIITHWDRTLEERPLRKQVVLDETKPSRAVPSSQRFTLPEEAPIMRKVMGFLGDSARTLLRAGIAKERICVDPGAGFDKDANQDVVIQRATRSMVSMGYPLMCAVSRKRFTGALSGVVDAADRVLRAVAAVIGDAQPQVLFAPDPCVASECHADHLRVGTCARRLAFAASSQPVMERLGAKRAPVQAIA